jgi:hypothetical protein
VTGVLLGVGDIAAYAEKKLYAPVTASVIAEQMR